jgi:hypothetical protein
MKRLMQRMLEATPKRNLGNSAAETSKGFVSLWLIPTSRGASMFYRRDWSFRGARISAKELMEVQIDDNVDEIEITHIG